MLSPQRRVAGGAESISDPSLGPGHSVTDGQGQAVSQGQYKCLELSHKEHQENRTGERPKSFQGFLRPNRLALGEHHRRNGVVRWRIWSRTQLLFLFKVMVVLPAGVQPRAFGAEAVEDLTYTYTTRTEQSLHFFSFLLSRYVLWTYVGWIFVLG